MFYIIIIRTKRNTCFKPITILLQWSQITKKLTNCCYFSKIEGGLQRNHHSQNSSLFPLSGQRFTGCVTKELRTNVINFWKRIDQDNEGDLAKGSKIINANSSTDVNIIVQNIERDTRGSLNQMTTENNCD